MKLFACAILAMAMASCCAKSDALPAPSPTPAPRSPRNYTKLYPTEASGIYQTKRGKKVDLRGFKSGMEVRNPYSNEVYLIP